jgi:hypothetical protein
MKIVLDVDGVVTDFLKEAMQTLGMEELIDTCEGPEIVFIQAVINAIPVEEQKKAIDRLDNTDFWIEMKPEPGAKEAIRFLREEGWEIHWVLQDARWTNWKKIRLDWLYTHFAALSNEVTFTREKFKVNGHIYIDDRPEFVEKWQEVHPHETALLYDRPYNQYCKIDKNRRFAWNYAIQRFKNMGITWKRNAI